MGAPLDAGSVLSIPPSQVLTSPWRRLPSASFDREGLMQIAARYGTYWGKAAPNSGQSPIWHPFAYHSLDVAAVTAALWSRSAAVRRAFSSVYDLPQSAAERLGAVLGRPARHAQAGPRSMASDGSVTKARVDA